MFVLFIVVELRVRDPLFDLRIFRRRNLSAGLATNLLVGFCLMIGLVSVPILVNIRLPDASHLSEAALQVGILLSALTVPMALAAIPGGWLSDRIGYRWTTMIGLALALIGFAADLADVDARRRRWPDRGRDGAGGRRLGADVLADQRVGHQRRGSG